MARTRVDIDEIETTRSEKLLALLMVIFISTGLIWSYSHLDRPEWQVGTSTLNDPALIARDQAWSEASIAAERLRTARLAMETARETYRTSLDAGTDDPTLKAAYTQAQQRFDAATVRNTRAAAQVKKLQPAVRAAQRRIDDAIKHQQRVNFIKRLVLALLATGIALALLTLLRQRHSRYLPVGYAAVLSAGLLAIVMAVDYLGNYVDLADTGILILSLGGFALSLLAFFALQRYLARHIPERRVRKHECPFCGYPVRDGTHCEGCGRDVIAPCSSCQTPRRVGSRFCATCGADAHARPVRPSGEVSPAG